MAQVASFVPGRSKGAYDATRLIIIIMNTVQSQIVVWVLNSNKLIFYSEKKSPTLQNYKVSKYKFTPALALKWHPQVLIGQAKLFDISACSQSESGRQMHLQPLRFCFSPQELSHVLQRAVCHLAARIDNNVTFVKEWIIWAIVTLRSDNSVSIE